MAVTLDPTDRALLDGWQRDFPLTPRPFAEIAAALDLTETNVIERLRRLRGVGAVSRVGGALRPGAAGASTLAALSAPEWRIDEIAEIVGAEPGVNHSYLRENDWNIWFVATGPDRAHVDAALDRIRANTGLQVLDLRLVRPFNVDLGFALDGSGRPLPQARPAPARDALQPGDREILQAMSSGLDLVAAPFRALAETLGRPESDILSRIAQLSAAGVLSRVGVIVRHRALGWRSNAMVVWQAPDDDIERAGLALTAAPGVTLCYQRSPAPGVWPYNLYCMIHARSRREAMDALDLARRRAGLEDAPHQVLFSVRCFKQIGALVALKAGAPA